MRGADWVCHDCIHPFVVFKSCPLTDEPVSDADILPIDLKKGSREESEAWSAGCRWYFIVTEWGIVLAQPYKSEAVICLKKSWRFLEEFINSK